MNSYVHGDDQEAWCGGDLRLIPTMTVFDYMQVKTAHDAETSNTQRREALGRILKSGQHRRLAIAESRMMSDLDHLQSRQPNCSAVIATMRRYIALSLLAEPRVLRWPPLLLDGPPGIGKTYFARALAEAIQAPLFMVNCSSVTASFVLGGNSPSWAGSRPGKIVDVLRDSAVGNPIVLLDEVDKLRGDSRFDGYGPLYQLLEEETARTFEDEHIGVPVNASHILWLATSNNTARLPEPIKSRFEILPIHESSATDVSAIAQSIYENMLKKDSGWQARFSARLPSDVTMALSALPPREIRRVLMGAMGEAAMARDGHRKISIRHGDLNIHVEQERSRMGFLT